MVYAGGIVVLYLFVVMLVNLKRPARGAQRPAPAGPPGRRDGGWPCWPSWRRSSRCGWARPAARRRPALSPQNVEQIGRALYTDYLIPFELASILLLVAMIGAIILAKREL
ncbi:MAG: NADH-quinone oxidoreductase subunit J [Sphingobacterium sp.]|nr:NADH-quinone oxidoreductase subunit J [Sphingobacterium sp.]